MANLNRRTQVILAAFVLSLSSLALPAFLAAAEDGRIEQGRTLFTEQAEPQCAVCHTLADAGASGTIGPNFDVMQPSYDVVMRAITQGIGPMMPYDELSEEEKDALSHYVSTVAGSE